MMERFKRLRLSVRVKILVTFIGIMVLPLLVVNVLMTNLIEDSADTKTANQLVLGIDLLRGALDRDLDEMSLQADSLSRDERLTEVLAGIPELAEFGVGQLLAQQSEEAPPLPERLADLHRQSWAIALRHGLVAPKTLPNSLVAGWNNAQAAFQARHAQAEEIATLGLQNANLVRSADDQTVLPVSLEQASRWLERSDRLKQALLKSYGLDFLAVVRLDDGLRANYDARIEPLEWAVSTDENNSAAELFRVFPHFRSSSQRPISDRVMTSEGLMATVAFPLFLEDRAADELGEAELVVLTARLLSQGDLDELRQSIDQDFSLLTIESRNNDQFNVLLTTRFDNLGQPLVYQPLEPEAATLIGELLREPSQLDTDFGFNRTLEVDGELYMERYELITSPRSGERYFMPGLFRSTVARSVEAEAYAELQAYLVILAVLTVGLIVLAAYFITLGITTPIRRLLSGIRGLGRRIETNEAFEPVRVEGNDEITDLAESFNAMASNLVTAYGEIRAYSRNLQSMVDERTRELYETNSELSAANKEMMRERRVASMVQRAILPTNSGEGLQLDIRVTTTPMADVSGDYYDVFELPRGRTGILVADVSGHGVPAALITMMSKVAFGNMARQFDNPDTTCAAVNRNLTPTLSDIGFYLTAFYMIVDREQGRVSFTNAGHNKGILVNRSTGELRHLDSRGFFIGSIAEADYGSESAPFTPGDRIVLFTDGIVEARNEAGTFYEQERLEAIVRGTLQGSAENVVDEIEQSVQDYLGGTPPSDDRTVVVIDCQPGR